jgi:hypothetical protein
MTRWKVLAARWDRALTWESWWEPGLGPLRAVIQLGLQNFSLSFQVSDGGKPACYTRFFSMDFSPFIVCSTAVYWWQNRNVRNMEYASGDEVRFGNGTLGTVANNFGDGTIVVITGSGVTRCSTRVPEDQIRRVK